MENLDKQLNKMPQYKLCKRADLRIRLRLAYVNVRETLTLSGELMRQPKFQVVTASLVLLSLVISIPGYAYASPGVTEGHWLYGVKRNLEEVELGLKTTPEAQAVTLAKLTERRLEEAAHLSQEEEVREEAVTATINEALELDQASQVAFEAIAEPVIKEETIKKIEEKKQDQLKALTTVAQDIGLESEEETLDTITYALETVKTAPGRPWGRFKKHLPESLEEESEDEDEEESEDKPESVIEEDEEEEEPSKPRGRFITPGQAKKLERNYEAVIDDINELDQDLKKKQYDRMDIEALYGRLGKKLKETEEQIEEGELESASDTLESTKAFTKTAEYFIKEKEKEKKKSKKKKSRKKKYYNEEDEEEDEEDYYQGFWQFYKNENKKIPPGQLKKIDYNEEDRDEEDDDHRDRDEEDEEDD